MSRPYDPIAEWRRQIEAARQRRLGTRPDPTPTTGGTA